jgi:hypothetical protein
MIFEEISINELKPYIAFAFMEDEDLFKKWHIVQGEPLECIEDTYNRIIDTIGHFYIECYRIVANEVIIGYTVLCKEYGLLYSFGINKQFRDKETLKNWFAEIRNILGIFDCILWKKNERAINHLIKQGMTIKNTTDDYIILNYSTCQQED